MTQTHHTVPQNHNESEEATLQPDTNALKSGAQLLVDAFLEEGVEYIFGYPGGAVLPFTTRFTTSKSSIFSTVMNKVQPMRQKVMRA